MVRRYSDTAYATRITAVTTYAATMYPAFCGTSGTNPSPLLPPERQRVRLQHDRLRVQRPEQVDAQVDEGQKQQSADPQHRRIARPQPRFPHRPAQQQVAQKE